MYTYRDITTPEKLLYSSLDVRIKWFSEEFNRWHRSYSLSMSYDLISYNLTFNVIVDCVVGS